MAINLISWVLYFSFVAAMLSLNWYPDMVSFDGPHGSIKLLIWGIYAAFLAYSIHCSLRENIFRTVRKMSDYYWGRQIGLDLYIGVFLAMVIIYLNEGFAAVAIWIIPTLIFANLSVLLYFAIHFDSIVSKLVF